MSNNKIIVDLWKKWKQAKITIVVIVMCFIITLNSRIHKSTDLVNRMMQISFDILIISLTILLNLYAVPKVIWGWGFLQNAWYFIFFCHLYCFWPCLHIWWLSLSHPHHISKECLPIINMGFINIDIPKPGYKEFGSK